MVLWFSPVNHNWIASWVLTEQFVLHCIDPHTRLRATGLVTVLLQELGLSVTLGNEESCKLAVRALFLGRQDCEYARPHGGMHSCMIQRAGRTRE